MTAEQFIWARRLALAGASAMLIGALVDVIEPRGSTHTPEERAALTALITALVNDARICHSNQRVRPVR